jgi:MFS family permease
MTRIATSWLVYRLTDSAWLLGVVGFAGQIPTFLLAPFAGVWVDRLNRHRLLIVTQVLAMLQSFALAVLALTNRITVWDVIWLSAFQGLINAFDMPARQAFVVEMVEDREDLGNAIALNSSMVNMARLIGPSLAGIIIAAVGEGYCFLIDGFSYLAVIASLLMMQLTPEIAIRQRAKSMIGELKEGWTYVSRSSAIRALLLLLALVSLVGMPYTVLMPIFAGSILHGGAHTLVRYGRDGSRVYLRVQPMIDFFLKNSNQKYPDTPNAPTTATTFSADFGTGARLHPLQKI